MMLGSASHTMKHRQQQQQEQQKRGDHVALQGIALGSAHCRKCKRSLSWRNKRLSSIMSWFSSVLSWTEDALPLPLLVLPMLYASVPL